MQQYLPFTVLKPYLSFNRLMKYAGCNSTYRLRYWNTSMSSSSRSSSISMLQQYLPFTVLKRVLSKHLRRFSSTVATVLTVYGIETKGKNNEKTIHSSCNSTYRLRYWNPLGKFWPTARNCSLQQYLPFTVLKPSWIQNR